MSHVLGQYRVYTRETLMGAWTVRPELRLGALPYVQRAAGQVTIARLVQTYGPGSEAQPYINWTNHWCRITYTPAGGNEADIFYGHLSEQTLNEAERQVEWGAVSIEAQLWNLSFSDGFGEGMLEGGPCEEVSLAVFNRDLEQPLGWRSESLYHFRRDEIYKEADGAGYEFDKCYAFGTKAPWDAWQVIRTLFITHCPNGGSQHCRIGFYPVATPAALEALEGLCAKWDMTRASGAEVLDILCAKAGDLAWAVDWSEEGEFGYDFCRVRIFSRVYDDRDPATQAVHDVKGAGSLPVECLPSNVTITVKDRVTEVLALGAPVRVQFTVRYTDAGGALMRPRYVRGWTDAEEEAWEDADEEAAESAAMEHVFRRLYLPYDQVSGGVSTWNVFARPSAEDYFSEPGDKLVIGEWRDGFIAAPRKVLPRNLTCAGYTYTSQTEQEPLTWEETGPGTAEEHPILCWWAPAPKPEYADVTAISGCRPLRNETGVELSAAFRNQANYPYAGGQTNGAPNWQHLVITITIETDVRVGWLAATEYTLWGGKKDTQRRRLVIEVPDAEWWCALPGTVIGMDAAGEATTVHGVLRNDLPKLKAAAEQALSRYSNRHWQASLALVDVDPGIKPGDFVGNYGPYALQSPILALEYRLVVEPAGTILYCGRSVPRRHV